MKMIELWWTEPDVGDQSMEDEHGEFWERVALQTFDVSLTDKILLDFGCNQGGFLRKLYDDAVRGRLPEFRHWNHPVFEKMVVKS